MVCSNECKGTVKYLLLFRSTHANCVILQEKTRAVRELTATVLARAPKMCNFIEWQDKKVVIYRYLQYISPF